MWVSWVLGNDHYKRATLVVVGVARLRALTAPWRWVLSIWSFTGNGDVSIRLKNSQLTWKSPNKDNSYLKYCAVLYDHFNVHFEYVWFSFKPYIRIVLLSNRIIALGFLCSAFFHQHLWYEKTESKLNFFVLKINRHCFRDTRILLEKPHIQNQRERSILTKNNKVKYSLQ